MPPARRQAVRARPLTQVFEIAVAASSLNPARRASVPLGSGSSAVEETTIITQRRPATTIGIPTVDRIPTRWGGLGNPPALPVPGRIRRYEQAGRSPCPLRQRRSSPERPPRPEDREQLAALRGAGEFRGSAIGLVTHDDHERDVNDARDLPRRRTGRRPAAGRPRLQASPRAVTRPVPRPERGARGCSPRPPGALRAVRRRRARRSVTSLATPYTTPSSGILRVFRSGPRRTEPSAQMTRFTNPITSSPRWKAASTSRDACRSSRWSRTSRTAGSAAPDSSIRASARRRG